MIRLAWSSPTTLSIAPLQDGLNLGAEARMNVPGTIDGNWRWRVADASIAGDALDRLRGPTEAAHR